MAAGKMKVRPVEARVGELTHGEIDEKNQQWLDRQPMRVGCAIPGCAWEFNGPAAEGRQAAVEHRSRAHPDLRVLTAAERKAAKIAVLDADRERRLETDRQRAALVALDNGEPQPAPVHAEPAPTPAAVVPPWTRRKWDRLDALQAVQAFADEHGRAPKIKEAKNNRALPSAQSAIKLFGSWPDMIEAAGFSKPTRGGQPGSVREPQGTRRKHAAAAGRWTAETALAAIKEFAVAHDRPPSLSDARGNPGLPSEPTCKKLFGAWSLAIEAAGFPRPTHGSHGKRPRQPEPADAPPTAQEAADGPAPVPSVSPAVPADPDRKEPLSASEWACEFRLAADLIEEAADLEARLADVRARLAAQLASIAPVVASTPA